MKLTAKQKKFADEYIKSGNATQSAIAAGYARRSARQVAAANMSKHDIKAYIAARMDQIETNRIMGAKEAVELLTSIARGELLETVVVATPKGIRQVEKTADLRTRMKAINEILKRYPENNKLMEQQVRKIKAEADILEAQAKEIQGGGNLQDDNLLKIAASLEAVHEVNNQTASGPS